MQNGSERGVRASKENLEEVEGGAHERKSGDKKKKAAKKKGTQTLAFKAERESRRGAPGLEWLEKRT